MTSPQPIIIGSYCSDFTITQPLSGEDYYYYTATAADSSVYYLATSRVTHGDGTSSKQVDFNGIGTVRIIPGVFVVPQAQGGSVTISSSVAEDVFKEFRFNLQWNNAITPDFTSSSSVIPLHRRRYLMWNNTGAGTSGQVYDAAKADRFVEIETPDVVTRGVKFSGSAMSQTTTKNLLLDTTGSPSTLAIENLRFSATQTSPTIQQRASQCKYLILKTDLDTINTTAVTASKQLRYLMYNTTQNRFELVDLYDPDVDSPYIQRCAYRVAIQTNCNITASGIATGTGGSVTVDTPTTTWGIDVYNVATATGNPTPTAVSLTGFTSTTFPPGFTSASRSHQRSFGFGVTGAVGYNVGSFENSAGVAFTDNTVLNGNLTRDGLQDVVINLPVGFTYTDFTGTGGITSGGTQVTTTDVMKFVFTNQLVDKTVEELFTNLNVTLLKLQSIPSSSPACSIGGVFRDFSPITGVTSSDNYLGLENVTPNNTPPIEPSVPQAGIASNSTNRAINLIVRNYYKFFNPARATQFKFYDLGKGNEYLWQARWPSGSGDTYTYVGANGDTLTYYPSSSITERQRGWILEYDTSVTPPGVRLKWALTGKYLTLASGGSFTADNTPYTVSPTLVDRAACAAVFNCVQCTSIDSSGVCLPVSNPYIGNLTPPTGRSPVSISVSGISPIPSYGTFRIRLIDGGSPSVNRGILQFSLTQIARGSPVGGSPIGGSPIFTFQQGTAPFAFVGTSSPSPAPPGTITDFVFTISSGVISRASRNRKAVFIQAADDSTLYLKYNTAGNVNRIEIQSSNRPSDEDGFAWAIVDAPRSPSTASPLPGAQRRFNLVSVIPGSPTPSLSSRYLQPNGTIGPVNTAAVFVFEGLTTDLDSAVINTSQP